jgi:membrane protease YdiL (CAAX protease family)
MSIELWPSDAGIHMEDLRLVIPIAGCLFSFILYWFIRKSDKLKQKFLNKYGDERGSSLFILFAKYVGFVSMGLLPAIAYFIAFPDTSLSDIGLVLKTETLPATLVWIAIAGAVLIPLMFFSSRKPATMAVYPEVRAKEWNIKMVIGYLASWAAYLLGYEILFRGLLLFPLVERIGLWPAIAVNIAMYSGTHIPKGPAETIGAIPLGTLFCLLSVQTGSIWCAFFIHVIMAWTSSLTALKYNPEMKMIRK